MVIEPTVEPIVLSDDESETSSEDSEDSDDDDDYERAWGGRSYGRCYHCGTLHSLDSYCAVYYEVTHCRPAWSLAAGVSIQMNC